MTCVIVKLPAASQIDQKYVEANEKFHEEMLVAFKQYDELNRGREGRRGICDCVPNYGLK